MSQPVMWGTHQQFVERYERYLVGTLSNRDGLQGLIAQIGSVLEGRGVRRLLDCAAGTGFPSLDLAETADDLGLETVHVCDGDPTMAAELVRQATVRKIPLEAHVPCPGPNHSEAPIIDDLVINWGDLSSIPGHYDYVLCRGNSLAYADTWSGQEDVSSLATIGSHLAHMADKVLPGGHLHIDAPWILTPGNGPKPVIDTPTLTITEEIKDHDDHREWLLQFIERDEEGNEEEIPFRRLSSRLTIHDVADELQKLGQFDGIEPFQMEAERVVYGTIIARKRW